MNDFEKATKGLIIKPRSSRSPLHSPTTLKSNLYSDDSDYERKLTQFRERLADRQEILFADGRYGVLVIFQGMDTSGKDGAIKEVMSGLNPQGVTVTSFRAPSEEERKQDFLRRAHSTLPSRGKIGIFNRSYYEEVLVTRVHPEILELQNLPPFGSTEALMKDRYQNIIQFEDYLYRQGYRIVKFFLHISKKEQKERLLKRIVQPHKNWKFDPNDIRDRAHWSHYQKAYNDCIKATSTKNAPWYVIPADDKKTARLLISQILFDRLENLPVRSPPISRERKRTLEEIKQYLLNDEKPKKRAR